jgi:hypothetical protein
MEVELDIFSGRPNPRWQADEAVADELRRLENGLAPADGPAPAPPGLGYRGFVYTIDGRPRRAFLGRIERDGKVLDDSRRAIERRLLGALPAELAPLGERIAPLLAGAQETG